MLLRIFRLGNLSLYYGFWFMDRDDSKGNGSYEKENFFWEIFELWAPKMYCVFIHLKFHQITMGNLTEVEKRLVK